MTMYRMMNCTSPPNSAVPDAAPATNASAKTPIGASSSTQRIMTSIASPIAANSATTGSRRAGSSIVRAIAKMKVNKITGRIESLAAAANTLDGMKDRTKSPMPATELWTVPGSTAAKPARIASAAGAESGNMPSRNGMPMAPTTADATYRAMNQATARAAVRPSLAMRALPTMPLMSSATISGITTIFNASSHKPPMMPRTALAAPFACGW